MTAGQWWRAREGPADRARWLGLISRPVRLTLAGATLRTGERPALGQAERLAAADLGAESLGIVRRLAVPRAPTSAGRLRPAIRARDNSPAGQVRLDDIDLDGAGQPARSPDGDWSGDRLLDSDDRQHTQWDVPLWRRLAVALQLPTYLLLDRSGPIEWPDLLFPYQVEGIRALLERDALLLADDMGLGKTIQALAAIRILVLRRLAERALVVAPAGLLAQWRDALARWAPELRVSTVRGPTVERVWQWRTPAHVYLVSYDTLRADCTTNPASPPRRQPWDVVVLDEAQRIKNRDAEVSRATKLLPRRRAWALTGTPLENSIDDLASVLEFVRTDADEQDARHPHGPLAGPALRARQREVQLRRRRADVLPELPPLTTTRVPLTLTGRQRDTYDRVERDGVLSLRERGASVRVENVLELIVRLKQVCNVCPSGGRSAKLDDLVERLETLQAEGHRALIFTQFVDERFGARGIAARLAAFSPLVYTGELSPAERDAVVARFRERPEHTALILSLRAGAEGLNLQDASYVFHFDRWWNPARERQAEGRSHRLGQTRPVHVYTYVCEGTIEERIDATLRARQRLFDEVIDGVSLELPALGDEELFGLFDLPSPRS